MHVGRSEAFSTGTSDNNRAGIVRGRKHGSTTALIDGSLAHRPPGGTSQTGQGSSASRTILAAPRRPRRAGIQPRLQQQMLGRN
ncbi:hypothetical protein EJ03DRAFT_324340 [Teratosphaeria nubilosa]|uniref:Uncharacterized protein n=1 Tax=Teratosphaeria nubilosa TaxID=161662 RepID=A0A6G1LJJ7_9PEZI|nr:hypothetical protein EJ03DRAFT_324340 [Teratosphaeria nubilosa]